ncbi:MAG: creatininase family protein [Anaerolineales bacterium]|nr:creatininase family protein [Anaerolineales bacterium]
MSDEVRLARLSQPEAESRLKNSRLAVMAPGSIEQHGPHLPLGTDAFAADALAEEVARKLNTVLVPLPLVGVSPYHLSWAGSLSFQPQTMIAVIEDICECLANHGVDKVLFVNWHEGNTPTLRLAGDSVQRKFKMRVVIAESHIITNKLFGERAQLTHAGNMETAAVLMYDPSLVNLTKATNPTPQSEGDAGHAIFRQRDVFPIMRDFHEVASTGWYGKPEEATLELADEIRAKVSDYIVEKARVEFARDRGDII